MPVRLDSLTAARVAGWFPDSKYGRPTPEECAELTAVINKEVCLGARIKEALAVVKRQSAHYKEAAKLARLVEKELTGIIKLSSGGITTPGREVFDLLTAAIKFTDVNHGPRAGAPIADWHYYASIWAPRVAKILAKPGRRLPSLNSDTGPVTAVVSKILRHCYDVDVDQAQIGRRLRDGKARQKSRLDLA
jgi:hypothetical protein